MKNPIIVTSLEEDFRKIGLIKESVQVARSEEDDTDLTEKNQKLTSGGTRKAPTRAGHKEYLKAKKADPAGFRKAAKMKAIAAKKGPAKLKARKLRLKRKKKGLTASFDPSELMKSLANAAIIAERVQTAFTEWYEADQFDAETDEMFVHYAEQLEGIAEDFAAAATSLHEGTEEFDKDEIAAAFSENLQIVLDAVDLYDEAKKAVSAEASDDEEQDDEEEEDEEGND